MCMDKKNRPHRSGKESAVDPDQSSYFKEGEEFLADEQIKLGDLIELVWEERKKVLVSILFFTFLGLFHIAFTPTEFSVNSLFLADRQSQQGGIDQILGAGLSRTLNLGRNPVDTNLPPQFYSEIIETIDFQSELMHREIRFSRFDQPMTVHSFFTEHYQEPFRSRVYNFILNNTVRIPVRLIRTIENIFREQETSSMELEGEDLLEALRIADTNLLRNGYFVLNPRVKRTMEELTSRVSINYESLKIEVSTNMPDRMAAIELNRIVVDLVQQYLIDYRIEKAREYLTYIELLYTEAEERYEDALKELALFTDRNKGSLTALAEIEQERLEDRRDLAFQLYSSLASRVEEARARLKEDTPVFTSFQNPVFPDRPSGANILVLPVAVIAGIVIGIGWVLLLRIISSFMKSTRNRISELKESVEDSNS